MRKRNKIAILCGFIFFPILLQAQEAKTGNRIGVEFGGNVFLGETIVPERVRESKSLYEEDGFSCGFPAPEQTVGNFYGGIKFESFFLKERLGFSAGLRFSRLSSEINAYWKYSYFMWLFRQNETTTDYLSIQKISQDNYYLGVPLELRFLLKKRTYSAFNPYLKLGTSVNYRVSTKNSITFFDQAMIRHSGELNEQIENPKPFYAWVYPAFGFRFGRPKSIWFNMEFNFPGFLIEDKSQTFVRTDFGFGMEFSIQIPFSK